MGWKTDMVAAAKTKEEKNRLLKAFSRGAQTPQEANTFAQGRRGRTHKVRPGETWESITDSPRQEMMAIMANPGVKRLHTGMTIWLPSDDAYLSHSRMAYESGELSDDYKRSLEASLGKLPLGAQQERYWSDFYMGRPSTPEPTTALEEAGVSPVTVTTTPQPPQDVGNYSPLAAPDTEHLTQRGVSPPSPSRDVFPGVPMIDPDTGGFTYISSPQVPSSEELYGQYDQRRVTRERAPDSNELYGQYGLDDISKMPSIYEVPTSRGLYERHFERVTRPIEQPPRGAYGQSGLLGNEARFGEGLNAAIGSALNFIRGEDPREPWQGLLNAPRTEETVFVEAKDERSIANVPTSDELAAPRLQGDARPGTARRTNDDLVNAWLARHGVMTDNPEYQAAIVKELYKRGTISQEEIEWAINRGAFEMADDFGRSDETADFYGGGNTQFGSYYPYGGFGGYGGSGYGYGGYTTEEPERPGVVGRTFARGTRGVRWAF